MKAYRIELLVIDFDGLGPDGVRSTIENTRYANHCILPRVMAVDERDIGEWSDDNPLNKRSTAAEEFRRLFATPVAGTVEKDAARLDYVLAHGLPMMSGGKFRCFEFAEEGWFDDPRAALDAAIEAHKARSPSCGS